MGIRRLGRPAGYNYPIGLNGLITTTSNTVVDYLVVAGGGSGGEYIGGGGGAGGFRTASGYSVATTTNYTIVVGAGGANGSTSGVLGSNGSNSGIHNTSTSIWSTGGGRGGGFPGSAQYRAGDGGSGGAGRSWPPGSPFFIEANQRGVGTPGEGNNGGIGGVSPGGLVLAGGGGGAGGAGGAASGSTSGSGGPGLTSSLSGSPGTYSAGGGGGAEGPASAGNGTPGVSGNGTPNNTTGGSGGTNTGGGGGGTGLVPPYVNVGSSGGKGIVIIRYAGSTQQATGGTISTPSNYVVHTFTGDGTFATNSDFGQTQTFSGNYSIN